MVAVAAAEDISTVADEGVTNPAEPRSRRASAPLRTGERYEVGAPIGRGGMGEVVAAYDAQIGRDVAIKRLHAARPTLAQLSRFLREARIQGRLEHPAIPPVHELASDASGRPYFVMKKLAGVTLSEVLRDPLRHDDFSRQDLLRAFVEVCRAIELAHSRGVVHRDLKPSNVLLGNHEVYVLDWGIARELDVPEPRDAPVLGTKGYMPPEQAAGRPVDARADVFALGCVLHEILTGQPLSSRRPPSSPPRDDVPPELAIACRRAIEPERDRRTASARELADAVQRYLDGDRDVGYRHELACKHLELARAAIAPSLGAGGDDENRRRIAMREAGRALALEPALAGAADLVGRLMLSPPPVTPKAVVDELAALDIAQDRRQLRQVVMISVLYLAVIPLMCLLGIRDTTYMIALAAVLLVNTGGQVAALLSTRVMRFGWPLGVLSGLSVTALLAHMFSPFLIAPGFVAVSMMSCAMVSQARDRRVVVALAVAFIATVLGVWAAESVGLLAQTMWIAGGTVVLRSPLDGVDSFPVLPGLAVSFVSLVASAASLAHVAARNQHRAREQLHVQAWHLRQLL